MATPKAANKSTKKAAPRTKAQLQRLTAEQLGIIKIPERELEIPELGGSVLLRGFNGVRTRLARTYATSDDKLDQDRWGLMHVYFGMIEPDITCGNAETHEHTSECFKVLETLDQQFNLIVQRIALTVFALNMGGEADTISKG